MLITAILPRKNIRPSCEFLHFSRSYRCGRYITLIWALKEQSIPNILISSFLTVAHATTQVLRMQLIWTVILFVAIYLALGPGASAGCGSTSVKKVSQDTCAGTVDTDELDNRVKRDYAEKESRPGASTLPVPPLEKINGKPGKPGTPGQPGAAGVTGHPGLPGKAGEPGAKGKPGQPGADGGPGEQGKPGTPGDPGEPGEPGHPGNLGTPGTPGAPGSPGRMGGTGTAGQNGGSPGTPGIPGTPGTPGVPGVAGPPGFPGRPGNPGPPGDPGLPGHPGPIVIDGVPYVEPETANEPSEGSIPLEHLPYVPL